jgi:mono/diheme cytochrome c family protein
MNRCRIWAGVSTLLVVVAGYSVLSGAQQAGQSVKPQVKKVPAANVNSASGKEMYTAYCAACHGATGAGNGPAASALKTPPSNLTQLAKSNGGKFPYAKVQQSIKGDPDMPAAHGSQQMPVWGQTFIQLSHQSEAETQLRIKNITDYIASLQAK